MTRDRDVTQAIYNWLLEQGYAPSWCDVGLTMIYARNWYLWEFIAQKHSLRLVHRRWLHREDHQPLDLDMGHPRLFEQLRTLLDLEPGEVDEPIL